MDQKPIDNRDDARLLPRFRATGTLLERHRAGRSQAAALAEGLDENPVAQRQSVKQEPGDLRGIPVIGVGVGGVSPGTSPESVIDRIDRERERKAKSAIDEPMVAWA